MAKFVFLTALHHRPILSRSKFCALCNHDNAEVAPARVPHADFGSDLVHIKRLLRNEYYVGPAGDSAVNGDPTGVSAHDFDDHDAVMSLGGSVHAVDRLSHTVHCASKANSEIS